MSQGFGDKHHAALQRLFDIAKHDTGQSRRVADFLMAWWNPDDLGRWDFRDFWALDRVICDDILLVMDGIRWAQSYPDALGYKQDIMAVIRAWRPDIEV